MIVTEILNARLRGQLSSRRKVVQEANRRGLLVGIWSRVVKPIGRAEAKLKAVESADGSDQNCAVPDRWRPLFKRIFVKAALHAAHTR